MVLRQLEYLSALAKERHFGRAAEACHVSQPALSVAIRKLESELGIELVHRGRRYDDLTAQGTEVLRWARQILAGVDSLSSEVARLSGDLSGKLRIGAIPTALPVIGKIASPLLAEHPSIELEVRSHSALEIAFQVESFAVDVGITYLEEHPPRGLRAVPVFHERYAFLTAGATTGESTIPWSALDGTALCLLTPEMRNRRIVESTLAAAGATTTTLVETDSISALLSFARQGWSSVVSEAWLDLYGIPAGMQALRLVEPDLTQAIGILTRDSTHLPPLVAAFLATARPLAT